MSVLAALADSGHGAQLTLRTYGHVIEELDGAPQMGAEEAILAARSSPAAHQLPKAAGD